MKKIYSLLLLGTIALTSQAQSLDDIIAKNIEARGGMDKLKKLNSVVVEANVNANGMEIPVKTYILNNKGYKMALTIMGMDCYLVANTKEGYSYFPVQGQKEPEKMPDDMLKAMAYEFDLAGEFVNWREKKYELVYQGEDDVDGTKCYKILCTFPDKSEKRFYIDKESNQIIKEIEKQEVNGKSLETASEFSNFKEIDGYTFPFEINSDQGPSKITKVTVNTDIPESTFQISK